MLDARNFYVIKQADGTLWNFTYKDNFGIIYRIFEKNSWSTYNILVKDASKAFSALILPDNRICIFYQSSFGNLLLKVYSGGEWTEYSILHKKNDNANDIQFKTIYAAGKIQIFYSILQPHDNNRTLFHQTLTLYNNVNVSSPVIIDTTNVNHVNQFAVHAQDDNTICIMYQKLLNKYELGYKVYDADSTTWSKFYNLDKNISPYIDFSLGSVNQKLNILYIKNNGETSAVYNATGNQASLDHIKLAESNNLISCAIFRERDITYEFWISNNYLYSCYTNYMDANISPIESEGLKTMNIFKTSYIEISSDNACISNELYVEDGTPLTILPNNFFNYKEALKTKQSKVTSGGGKTEISSSDNMNSLQESLPINTGEKVVNIEMKLIKKDQLISQLNYIIKEEKSKVLLLNNKISVMEKNYLEWETLKSQLYKDISLLQEAVISKENQIHELEKAMIEKETKSININKFNSNNEEYNNKIEVMENQIEGYKVSIANLNRTIEDLNTKIRALEEKVALNSDKTNSSLFRKFFGSQ